MGFYGAYLYEKIAGEKISEGGNFEVLLKSG
jgi:hypothetical protein